MLISKNPIPITNCLYSTLNRTVLTLIHEFLRERPIKESEATFCPLDQRTFDCYWSTVRTLASYKRIGNKIELFYLLPIAWLDRALSARRKNIKGIAQWWGATTG
jgi:hypothetical protein